MDICTVGCIVEFEVVKGEESQKNEADCNAR